MVFRGLRPVWGVAAAGMAAAVACGLAAGASTPPTIKIGAVFSTIGSGDVFGPQQIKGAQLAIDQINATGGVDGSMLRLVVQNDDSDPASGAVAMRTLIQHDGVVAVVGPTLSQVAFKADPVANELKTPVLGVSNTASGLVGKCSFPCTWSWRDSLGEAIAVPADVAAYVFNAHPSTAAIVYARGDLLGIQEAQLAAESFPQNGVRVVGKVAVPATGSVAAAVASALSERPQVLFVGTVSGPTAVAVIKAARAAGFSGTFLGGNTMNSDATAALAGRAGVGARSASAWYRGNDFPANSAFVTAYRQTYSAAPDQFATQAYVGVQVIADALQRAGIAKSHAPIAAQRAMLQRALPNVTLLTPLGPFRFTSDHDVSQIVWVLAMDGHGGHTLAGFCDPGC
jgi:branched-chain amino acid transport system substrate-binding protein